MAYLKYGLVLASFILLTASCGTSLQVMDTLAEEQIQAGVSCYEIAPISVAKGVLVPAHFEDAVLAYVKMGLEEQELLTHQQKATHRVEIEITYYRMRNSVSREMFGVLAGKDGLNSLVTVINLTENKVVAQSTVKTFNIMDIGAMDDIARWHARRLVKFLSGKEEEPL